jgi:hypothetical protein
MKSLALEQRSGCLRAVLLLASAAACVLGHTAAVQAAPAIVSYYELNEPSLTGLGFLADGKSLYVGGCSVFDLESRRQLAGCRYPANVRWGNVSPDGTLLLATAVDANGGHAKSFQLNSQTGTVHSVRQGIHFSPPIAIHPNNRLWAAAEGGKSESAAETVSITGRNWKIIRNRIYADTQRIFALEFVNAGTLLLVNGGGPMGGATLNTSTWSARTDDKTMSAVVPVLQRSSDGRFAIQTSQTAVEIVSLTDQLAIARLDFEPNAEEIQAAFSQDGRWLAMKGYRLFNGSRKYGFALLSLISSK